MTTESFYIKTREEFESFKSRTDAAPVQFGAQFETLFEQGELIFFDMSDGYGFVHKKKAFGLAKPKTEIYILNYHDKMPKKLQHKDPKKSKGLFEDMFKEGTEFFYIPNMR